MNQWVVIGRNFQTGQEWIEKQGLSQVEASHLVIRLISKLSTRSQQEYFAVHKKNSYFSKPAANLTKEYF